MKSSDKKLNEALLLAEQILAEQVAPKLEPFRKPYRYKLAYGGRGSGKSWGVASLLVQRATQKKTKILCAREVQLSLEESVYALIIDTIARLKCSGWTIKKESIENVNGSKFIFRGLKDLRAANAVKSMEGIDIVWLEEAQSISHDSIKILIPTIRKEQSEIWATWNPESEDDPINELLDKENCYSVLLNWNDNPWFGETLRAEMDADYKLDPDEALHTWGGQPRKQGENCAMSRVDIRAAMERNADTEGAEEIGVDVARFGNDSTTIWKRKGLKIVDYKELNKSDTIAVVDAIEKVAGNNKKSIMIKIDEGYNPGVIDVCRERGMNIVPISFGGTASDPDKYNNIASEMWFTCPIKEMSIPDDQILLTQLADRRYKYDSKGRRCIEPKEDYKKRHGGKSPDKADGLLLCFYTGKNIKFSDDIIDQIRAARSARR